MTTKQRIKESLKRFVVEYESHGLPDHKAKDKLYYWLETEMTKLAESVREEEIKETAQLCYLECLAVECGEGECSQAIATKFPKLVTRLDEDNRLDLKAQYV